jgi:hypothetical protein
MLIDFAGGRLGGTSWPVGQFGQSMTLHGDGGYILHSFPDLVHTVSYLGLSRRGAFALVAEFKVLETESNTWYGLSFGHNGNYADKANYYFFLVNQNSSHFEISWRTAKEAKYYNATWSTQSQSAVIKVPTGPQNLKEQRLVTFVPSSIKVGDISQLCIVANEDSLFFYVNRLRVAQISRTEFDIGPFAGLVTVGMTKVQVREVLYLLPEDLARSRTIGDHALEYCSNQSDREHQLEELKKKTPKF